MIRRKLFAWLLVVSVLVLASYVLWLNKSETNSKKSKLQQIVELSLGRTLGGVWAAASEPSQCVGANGGRQQHHRYLVVHSRSRAASGQARRAWDILRSVASSGPHHKPTTTTTTGRNPSSTDAVSVAFLPSLAACYTDIDTIIHKQLLDTNLNSIRYLHIILIIPDSIDLVFTVYHELRSNGNSDAGSDTIGHSHLGQHTAESLHDWANGQLTATSESCLLSNATRTSDTRCCLGDSAYATDQPTSIIEASFSAQLRRWQQCANDILNGQQRGSQSRISVSQLPVGTTDAGHPISSVPPAATDSYKHMLESLCFSYNGDVDNQQAIARLWTNTSRLPLHPATVWDHQTWDLQMHSRLSRFFEKFNSSRASVRAVLEETSLDHDIWVRSLKQAAANCSTGNRTVVVVFCEVAYARILLNWMVFYSRLRAQNTDLPPVLVITPSPDLHRFLSRFYPCSLFLSPIPSLNMAAAFWKTRLRVFLWLSRWLYTVIHSDVDAVWMRNPVPLFLDRLNGTTAAVKARFLFSRDIYPGEQKEKWGATACMGLLAYRGGRKTSKTWMRAMQKFVQFKDDQRTINSILDDGSLAFDKKQVLLEQPEQAPLQWTCAHTDVHKYSVCLMPQKLAVRHCMNVASFEQYFVAHCHSSKQGGSKESMLRQKDLWRLTADIQPIDITQDRATLSRADASLIFHAEPP
ncbi:uncharacterized protein LOC135812831 [Sycon ciliatum]|uniref:uncharacterized protein LOC135812831 n=1 Tax=Sycon ciliatum TaxID=27933 RepID=UPI0020AA4025